MYKLMDAKRQNRKYPETFEIPLKNEINNLQIGEYVKLCFEEREARSERMWVKITRIKGDDFYGILHNQPFGLATVKYGDEVVFKSKHILGLM